MNRTKRQTVGDQDRVRCVEVNGRVYSTPSRPIAVICFDGCDPAYIEAASATGAIPRLDRMRREGFSTIALAAMPTFTNPNNVSIVCGAPPSVHGVSGNYYLDRVTDREVMMLDAAPMRTGTILSALSNLGVPIAVVTAKDKLRKALSLGLKAGVSLSAERAADTTLSANGITDVLALVGRDKASDQYSADLSLFTLDVGIALLAAAGAEFLYLSLSDYVQHRHAPEAPEALAFMRAVDERIGRLLDLGAIIGVVADHGMSDMATPEGRPNVLYLGDHLDQAFGPGAVRVICPITDPFVRHHGALGGFVRLHLQPGSAAPALDEVLAFVSELPGVALALSRAEACARFALPPEPEGDVAVIGMKGVALGARALDHDLSQLAGERLRSHGGLAEQPVPFIMSHPLTAAYAKRAGEAGALRNWDIFDAVLNGVEVA